MRARRSASIRREACTLDWVPRHRSGTVQALRRTGEVPAPELAQTLTSHADDTYVARKLSPPVTQPVSFGFGHSVLVRMTEAALQAEVAMNYEPSGVCWSLDAPLGMVLAL